MSNDHSTQRTIVFVHGLWLHAESWDRWVEFFRGHGYHAVAASWPGDGATTEASRRNPAALAGHGVAEIADHVAQQLQAFDRPPVLIGHSFGGLLVQNLLGRNLAAAAIAIDPAPIKGVLELPLAALKSALPVLSNPFNFRRAVSLTKAQFRYGFANAVSEAEATALYERYAMPAPARPLFQAATANFTPRAATQIDVHNASRGPLLLVAGGSDHTVPPVLVKSTLKRYRHSPAETEFKEFAGRGHSLVIDSGWQDLAEHSLAWLRSKRL